MTPRIFAALLFSSASALFWLVFALITNSEAVFPLGAAATGVAAIIAAFAAHRMRSDAHACETVKSTNVRGFVAGVLVSACTVAATAVVGFVIGALTSAFDPVSREFTLDLYDLFLSSIFLPGGILLGMVFFSPAYVFGGIAGLIYYQKV